MDEGSEKTWREAGDDLDVLDLTIEPIQVPQEREPSPPPVYSVRAPRVASPAPITVRDVTALALGAALVTVLLGLTGWFAQDTARS